MSMSLLDRLNATLAKKAERDSQNVIKCDDTQDKFEDDGWLETGKATSLKTVPYWETSIRVVDLYRLVWVPYYTLRDAKVCAVLCDNKEILGQSIRLPKDGEVVVEVFNMDKEGNRKHNRLLVIYEKDLISFNGNKRDLSYPIDHVKGFIGENTQMAWDMRLKDKMHNALETKYNSRKAKILFDTMICTADAFLRLAIEDISKNKEIAKELDAMKSIIDLHSEENDTRKCKVDIRSYAPAPKGAALIQTLAVGDWISWSHKLFKDSVVCAKIINITEDANVPLELSTMDTIRGHDSIQKCKLRSSATSSGQDHEYWSTTEQDDLVPKSSSGAVHDVSSSSSSGGGGGIGDGGGHNSTPGLKDHKKKREAEVWFGREAVQEVEFFTDSEGILRPRGGPFQLLSQFKLVRSVTEEESVGLDRGKDGSGGILNDELDDLPSIRRKSGSLDLSSSSTTVSTNHSQTGSLSPVVLTKAPVMTPQSTVKKSKIVGEVKSPIGTGGALGGDERKRTLEEAPNTTKLPNNSYKKQRQ